MNDVTNGCLLALYAALALAAALFVGRGIDINNWMGIMFGVVGLAVCALGAFRVHSRESYGRMERWEERERGARLERECAGR